MVVDHKRLSGLEKAKGHDDLDDYFHKKIGLAIYSRGRILRLMIGGCFAEKHDSKAEEKHLKICPKFALTGEATRRQNEKIIIATTI
jgi:hypothetical protein